MKRIPSSAARGNAGSGLSANDFSHARAVAFSMLSALPDPPSSQSPIRFAGHLVAWQMCYLGYLEADEEAIEKVRERLAARRSGIVRLVGLFATSASHLLVKANHQLDLSCRFRLGRGIDSVIAAIPGGLECPDHAVRDLTHALGRKRLPDPDETDAELFGSAFLEAGGWRGLARLLVRPLQAIVREMTDSRLDRLESLLLIKRGAPREELETELELEYAGLIPIEEEPAEGPQEPDEFRWVDKVVRGLSRAQYRLLKELYGDGSFQPLEAEELGGKLCRSDDPLEALRGLCRRVNEKLCDAGLPLQLQEVRGYWRLVAPY
jgi:hypothetical protein